MGSFIRALISSLGDIFNYYYKSIDLWPFTLDSPGSLTLMLEVHDQNADSHQPQGQRQAADNPRSPYTVG